LHVPRSSIIVYIQKSTNKHIYLIKQNIVGEKIKHVYTAYGALGSSFRSRMGLTPYRYAEKTDPLLIFGCWDSQTKIIFRHKALVVVVWREGDIVGLMKRRPEDIAAISEMKNVKHIAVSELIDTRIAKDRLRDWRVVVMGYRPIFLYEKHLDITFTFHSEKDKYFKAYGHYSLTPHFTNEEISKIKEFILKTNVDFGEVDILRDNSTGLIYIIDINDVSGGAIWSHMDNSESVIQYLSNQYKDIYLS